MFGEQWQRSFFGHSCHIFQMQRTNNCIDSLYGRLCLGQDLLILHNKMPKIMPYIIFHSSIIQRRSRKYYFLWAQKLLRDSYFHFQDYISILNLWFLCSSISDQILRVFWTSILKLCWLFFYCSFLAVLVEIWLDYNVGWEVFWRSVRLISTYCVLSLHHPI